MPSFVAGEPLDVRDPTQRPQLPDPGPDLGVHLGRVLGPSPHAGHAVEELLPLLDLVDDLARVFPREEFERERERGRAGDKKKSAA